MFTFTANDISSLKSYRDNLLYDTIIYNYFRGVHIE